MDVRPDHDRMVSYYTGEVAERAQRPVTTERQRALEAFIELCAEQGRARVLEVGCGAGRDGAELAAAGLDYAGVDLTPASAQYCRSRGLAALAASATALPFPDASFDAAWSMSTLMHLDDAESTAALDELRRVVRAGGVVEIGVWGGTSSTAEIDTAGRYFRRRTDAELRSELSRLGTVAEFSTWGHDGVYHYQRARLVRD